MSEVITSVVPIQWKLRGYLEAHNITAYKLAQAAQIAPPNIYRMLRGAGPKQFDREVLGRIIRALRDLTGKHVSVSDVLEEEAD
jgi:predicted transcriptional regulator